MSRVFQNIKAVLIDLSGTIHIDDTSIKGSQDAILKLREKGLKIKFVTNTTKESIQSLHQRLQNLNFDIKKDEIYSPLTTARQVIERQNLRPHFMLSDSAKQDFSGISTENPNAVVVGLSPQHFNYENMNIAFRILLDGATLIAINKARYFKRPDGLSLGTGAFVSALEFASNAKSMVVGKPDKGFFLEAIDATCQPSQCVMIGDDALDDIQGAIAAGMHGILVQTGKYRPDDESKISFSTYHVARDFPSAVEMILNN